MNYEQFKIKLQVALNIDAMILEDRDEFFNEWYETYKLTKYNRFVDFIREQFGQVNQETHSYFISERGMFLLGLEAKIKRVDGKEIFPVF